MEKVKVGGYMWAYPKEIKPEEPLLVKDETPIGREILLGLIFGFGYMTIIPLPFIFLIERLCNVWNVTLPDDVVSAISQLIGGVIVLGLMFGLVSKRTNKAIKKGVTQPNILSGLVTGAIMYGLSILTSIALVAIFGENITNANEASLDVLATEAPIVYCLLVCLVAPMVEEMIFRYYIYRPLERNRKVWHLEEGQLFTRKQYIINIIVALLISTTLFAAIHLSSSIAAGTLATDIKTLPAYLIPALPLGISYAKTKHIATPIVAHMTYNTIIVFLSFATANSNITSEVSQMIVRLFK